MIQENMMSDKELVNARKRLVRALSTIAQSMSDDKTKVNAEFASSSGMSPKIIRNTSGKCCEWCTGLAGQHDYPAKKEVYQRHDNCDCTVEYVVGKQRQNIWDKKVHLVEIEDSDIGYKNYAKNISGLFDANVDWKYEKITPISIEEELETSPIGREIMQWLSEMGLKIELDYVSKGDGDRGYNQDNKMVVFIKNVSSSRVAAQTVIHEVTHRRYEIGNCIWAEAVCMAQEKKHLVKRELTIPELRNKVKLAEDNYGDK